MQRIGFTFSRGDSKILLPFPESQVTLTWLLLIIGVEVTS